MTSTATFGMSQVSCDEFRLRAPGIDLPLHSVERGAEWGVVLRDLRCEQGHAGPEESRLQPRDKQRQAEPERCDLVAMALRGARNQAVQAEAPEVVGYPAGREGGEGEPEQGRDVLPELRRGEPGGEQPEDHQGAQESLDAAVGEP